MTTGIGPYVTPAPADTDLALNVLETTLISSHAMVNLGPSVVGGIMAHAETFNGQIPGPTMRLQKDDTVIVRFINELHHPTGIHWHGIELENAHDGSAFTQDAVASHGDASPVPGRSTYLYKFKVIRPGLYWYHPHHHHSTNQVFKGMYGMIIVADPNEAALITAGVLPPAANTVELMLSDVTVCKAPGSNDPQTYPTTLPWAGPGGVLPLQGTPTPTTLCDIPATHAAGAAIDEHGMPRASAFDLGDIPNIQQATGGVTNEGQTVLTNGVNVGSRGGTPTAPAPAPDPGAQLYDVVPGQGLRLQIVNCATVRYFRLLLTNNAGVPVPLVRVGGEGGLLTNAIVEGGVVGTFNFNYSSGEILLPPGSRADVVVTIPTTATGVWTLWTQDFQRTGAGAGQMGWPRTPTVPVMHLNVTGAVLAVPFSINAGDPVLAAVGASVESLGMATAALLIPNGPGSFSPTKFGLPNQNIVLTGGAIDGFGGMLPETVPYSNSSHIGSSRYAAVGIGDILELTVQNASTAHHPFHLHGFSMQPLTLANGLTTYTFPAEFRDNINIPGGFTLTFRIRIDQRPLADGLTNGGAFGRWMFHCHIFFHHHLGMMSELVACAANGREKPNVNVVGSWVYATQPDSAHRQGTFAADAIAGLTVTSLLAHLAGSAMPFGILTPTGLGTSFGTWSWTLDTSGLPDQVQYVYVTATDSDGRKDQTVFRVQVGGTSLGSDTGDPHITTVDGNHYDFQQAGEFTLLRDPEAFEIQVRQTPVPTATPVVDPNSGLTSCVSINTAVAIRVGGRRISYQPHPDSHVRLTLFVDGKAAPLPLRGRDLGGAHMIAIAAGDGSVVLQIIAASGAIIIITPWFWASYNVWLMNVTVANTIADRGLMGRIPKGTWLPVLPSGATVGPKPAGLHERYVALYRTFADAWRVTDETSLFMYAWGTSTTTFTDINWPAEQPPCKLKPEFAIPGAHPSLINIALAKAKRISKSITIKSLYNNCVFDVATTGDEALVKNYLLVQDLHLYGVAVHIFEDKLTTCLGQPLLITVIVIPFNRNGPSPEGKIRIFVDGNAAKSVKLDKRGRANYTTKNLKSGVHKIRAKFVGSGKQNYQACSSANLFHTVERKTQRPGSSESGNLHSHDKSLLKKNQNKRHK